jgi:hypothetical protein
VKVPRLSLFSDVLHMLPNVPCVQSYLALCGILLSAGHRFSERARAWERGASVCRASVFRVSLTKVAHLRLGASHSFSSVKECECSLGEVHFPQEIR